MGKKKHSYKVLVVDQGKLASSIVAKTIELGKEYGFELEAIIDDEIIMAHKSEDGKKTLMNAVLDAIPPFEGIKAEKAPEMKKI